MELAGLSHHPTALQGGNDDVAQIAVDIGRPDPPLSHEFPHELRRSSVRLDHEGVALLADAVQFYDRLIVEPPHVAVLRGQQRMQSILLTDFAGIGMAGRHQQLVGHVPVPAGAGLLHSR